MRRIKGFAAVCLLGFAYLASASGLAAGQAAPPHAWLFGSWTGGLFPAPEGLSSKACLGQPVVIFTRDVVMRAVLTDPNYIQRVIETARTNPGSTEFRFAPQSAPNAGLLGMTAAPAQAGFGCADPNALHVLRRGDNEITFPDCPDFPYPLQRCR